MNNKLAVIIPTYNEEDNIVNLIKEILNAYENSEIFVVDDSPNLLTLNAVKAYNNPKVKVFHRDKKGGRGSAIIYGIKYFIDNTNCDYFLEIDSDFSHPPKQIPELIKYAEQSKLDLLIASRYLGESKILNWPLSRRFFSKSANLIARLLLGVPVNDYTNGFRLYNKRAAIEVANSCGKLGSGFIALSEILVNLYYRQYSIGEIPTIFKNRLRGESSLSKEEIVNAIVGLYSIYKLKRKLKK